MTKLKIRDRKNTTAKALESLQELVNSFDGKFIADVNTVESDYFFAKIEADNEQPYGDFNYREWVNFNAFWRIEDGNLELLSVDNEDEVPYPRNRSYKIDQYQQINFADCIKCLESVIAKYNVETEKKDAQIEQFLRFCAEFNK